MSLEALRFALAKDDHLLCLLSHTMHLLQPLDVAVFKPFKKALDGMCVKLMRASPQAHITNMTYQARILKNAWYEVLKPSNVLAGFSYNRDSTTRSGIVLDRLDPAGKKTESSCRTQWRWYIRTIYLQKYPNKPSIEAPFLLPEVY